MSKIKYSFIFCFVFLIAYSNFVGVNATETEIDTSLFKYIENEDDTLTIYRYEGADETVVFPSEIDGKKVSCVGNGYVLSSSNTKTVIISEGITKLEYAFCECMELVTVSLPSTLKIIGDRTFDACYNLSNINLPEGLTSIGYAAFNECSSIEKLVVPDSVTYIGELAFFSEECMNIYGNPNSYVKTYADTHYVKFSCINHQNIVTDFAVSPTCGEYGKTEGSHCADCGIVFTKQYNIRPTGEHTWNNGICSVCQKSNPQNVPSIPNAEPIIVPTNKPAYEIAGVKKGDIITYSHDSYKVTNSNEKEMTVELIGTKRKVSYITIPNTIKIKGVSYKVTSIAKNAFKNNKTMKNVTIGSNITTIGANAFKGCSKLKTVKVKAKNIKSVGKNAFKGIHAKAKIKVPSSSLKKYKKLLSNKGQKSTVKIIK